jgi:hypothetical protein
MPANTQIIRDGKPVLLRWGMWHVNCLYDAAALEDSRVVVKLKDGRSEFFYMGFPNHPATYVFRKYHRFVDETDGEVFEIFPGDQYSAWR